ncbi:hypothetical protein ACFRDV_22100 [Streptomyces fagopyri]|uniref:hypothetical protein n=1 Tax=Streptomyces fagopyri TaxID=2662397 RepID=UPI0036A9BC56
MPTPAPTACLGVCNLAWRRAEHTHRTDGTPHDIPVSWGEPVHCAGCVARTRRQLAELPELLVAVTLEPLHGTRGTPTASSHSAPTDTTPWPGQAARLLIDLVAGGLAEIAADVRRVRGLGDHPVREAGVREGEWIGRTVRLLDASADWLLQEHPLAREPHDPVRTGREVTPSWNPAAQIATWHRAATRFTGRDKAPETKRFAPCKRCQGPWLAESRDLRLVDDEPYIECQDPDCQALLTHAEYGRYVRELAGETLAAQKQERLAPELAEVEARGHPDGAPDKAPA